MLNERGQCGCCSTTTTNTLSGFTRRRNNHLFFFAHFVILQLLVTMLRIVLSVATGYFAGRVQSYMEQSRRLTNVRKINMAHRYNEGERLSDNGGRDLPTLLGFPPALFYFMHDYLSAFYSTQEAFRMRNQKETREYLQVTPPKKGALSFIEDYTLARNAYRRVVLGETDDEKTEP